MLTTLAKVMTAAAVPSTLVKCLYLFFDLPDTPDTGQLPQGESEPEAEFTPRERRILLQKMFMQVQGPLLDNFTKCLPTFRPWWRVKEVKKSKDLLISTIPI